jgi:hypothetical protein
METKLQAVGKQIIRHPFNASIILGVLLSAVTWLWILQPIPISLYKVDDYLAVNIIVLLVFWGVGGVIGCAAQSLYITYISSDMWGKSNDLLLKVENGKVVATGDCFWGRENVFEASFPAYNFTVETSVVCTVSEYCKVHIPVTLEIEVGKGKSYDFQEFYTKVVLEAGVNSVEKFVKQLLEQPIAKNQHNFDRVAYDYVEQRISAAILLQNVASRLSFPVFALSNFTGFKLCLDNPTVRACKGSACTT